jgi:cytochrome c oxidase subunit II
MFGGLETAGRHADEIARLFWIMTAVAAVIWIVVTALTLHATRRGRPQWSERGGLVLVAIGGFVAPAIVLAGLLAIGMPALMRQLAAAPADSLRVTVIGEQFWWRVRYNAPGGTHVDLANELRLPRGRTIEVTLTSTNVIHSFWIPSLAGKMDMVPGRLTRLTLEPSTSGVFRGVCAEYCGASHARMAFAVDVMEPEAFDAWLVAESRGSATSERETGHRAFSAAGCAACHAIRGTTAAATIGPDLTHVGSRHTLAAGALANNPSELARWIANPGEIKPGSLMPPFGMLPSDQLQLIAAYVSGLR